ncbi:MAG: hypothetical protein H6737_05955 [Alphaproteobacteria bacterium]|nr:hypothetical protein [Alphaproteobacteria bacterium]
MPLTKMPAPTLDALLDHTSRLKHDLGKYVRFQGRWLPPDATVEARREALAADLLHTRRGPDGSVDAATVWAEFSGVLTGQVPLAGEPIDLSDDPDVAAILAAMAALGPVIGDLRADRLDAAGLDAGERAADDVAEAVRRLVDRVRSLVRERRS